MPTEDKMRKLLVVLLLVVVAGCAKDDRAKQGAKLLNTMTQVAAKEYEQAKTAEEKDAVAAEYFRQAPRFTQGIDDYMHGRQPVVAPEPAPAPTNPEPAPEPTP